jgi:hypothetical protein|tara:strand:+ start:345 stop:551 length:207 start_codon:yes stop_codon:yes gene_type:complete
MKSKFVFGMTFEILDDNQKKLKMEPKYERQYLALKKQAKHLMKIGNIKAYIEKLIEVERMKQILVFGN